MQIAYHIGAHGNDEDRLLKSTLRNADLLVQSRIAAPGPGNYRSLIRTTIQGLDGAPPADGTRDILLDSIIDDDDVQRLLLANGNFISVANRIFEHGVFYPQAESKTRALSRLFPDDELSLYFSISHPATFLQDALSRPKSKPIGEFLGISQPEDINWADAVRRIHAGAPDSELVIWCTEDAPLIWPQLIRHFMGLPENTPIADELAPLTGLMDQGGIEQLRKELDRDPTRDTIARQTIIADFWAEHAIEGADEEEISLFETDEESVAHMTENYDADIAEITAMEGVTLILPFS